MAKNIRIATAPTATAATTAARLIVRFPTLATLSSGLLDLLIAEATRAAEGYIGRPLARATYRELLTGNGQEVIRLGRAPLESITSIAVAGTTLETTSYGAVDELQPNVRRLTGTAGVYDIWPIARHAVGAVNSLSVAGVNELLNIEAVYVAGYWLPSMAGSQPVGSHLIPADLEGAVQRIIVDCREEEQRGTGVVSVKKGDRSKTWLEGAGLVSQSAMDVLERERVVYS